MTFLSTNERVLHCCRYEGWGFKNPTVNVFIQATFRFADRLPTRVLSIIIFCLAESCRSAVNTLELAQ